MNQINLFESSSAAFSPCRLYRYDLWRIWGDKDNFVQFICLNPSTADETKNDPTIRRCIDFAQTWGFDALCMTNLFAYRATKPKEMMKYEFPIGEENNKWLTETAAKAKLIIAAWSQYGTHLNRAVEVRKLIGREMFYLKISEKTNQPYHPLYLPKNSKPILFI
jgi:hypothetical protein